MKVKVQSEQIVMRNIHLNFLPFEDQDFGITVYRKKAEPNVYREGFSYYDFPDENGENVKFEISDTPQTGFLSFKLPPYNKTGLISRNIFQEFEKASKSDSRAFILNNEPYNRRLHFQLEHHAKGQKCIWLEPYFLKSRSIWGINIGYQFLVSDDFKSNGKVKQDRDILIASGTLNSRGYSNTDFYLFKHRLLQRFIKEILPTLNAKVTAKLKTEFLQIGGNLLKSKEYIFNGGSVANSAYMGLSRHKPLEQVPSEVFYNFIYRKGDREYAVALLKGLRGESFPSNFTGFERFFGLAFGNDKIKGIAVDAFTEQVVDEQITEIKNSGRNIIPVLILDSKRNPETDPICYLFKHRFTNAGIPCQVVTKDLIQNENSLKFSLGNIALQIFAKAGGKPWKIKPAGSEYLIIGIGQSYNIETTPEGKSVEKNITYSILTDSSGIFKDIQVLSEGIEKEDSYYKKLVTNIVSIIRSSPYKKITIHSPIRLSKDQILEKVVGQIGPDVELNVLVINSKTDHFV